MSGSKPRLNSTCWPDFTITRLELVIIPSSDPLPSSTVLYRPLPSLSLKLRPPDRQADRQGTRLGGIADIRQLTSEDLLRVLGHRPTENLLVDCVDELVGVSCRNEGVEHDRHALQVARRQRDGGVRPVDQGTAV